MADPRTSLLRQAVPETEPKEPKEPKELKRSATDILLRAFELAESAEPNSPAERAVLTER